MSVANSPLRYPGGKAVLSDFLADVVVANSLQDGTYVEPYAGGAGAALNLLFSEHVHRVMLNDIDPCIFAFWNTILKYKKDFVDLIWTTPVTIHEWRRQREIYRHQTRYSLIKVAFAGFFLNRCNRSGIIVSGGPIGGYNQNGKWKLDARYNKDELIRRIEKISLYKDRVSIFNMDAIDFLNQIVRKGKSLERTFVYLDPPYYVKGSQLYLNHYQPEDHAELARFIMKQTSFKWIISYNNVPEIHELYRQCKRINFNLDYTAHTRKIGTELLIFSKNLFLPDNLIPARQVC